MSNKTFSYIIKERQHGIRLDKVIFGLLQRKFPALKISRSFVQRYIPQGVYISEKEGVPKSSYTVNTGDVLVLDIDILNELYQNLLGYNDYSVFLKPIAGVLDVRFETKDFVIVYKPSGVIVFPDKNHKEEVLINYIINYYEEKGIQWRNLERAGVVHRLDKGTAGLMVFAKTREFHTYIKQQFESHRILKIYRAKIESIRSNSTVQWNNKPPDNLIKTFIQEGVSFDGLRGLLLNHNWYEMKGIIKRNPSNRRQMLFIPSLVEASGKSAITYFYFYNHNQIYALIRTGRMHQIRATLRYLGLYIEGDTMYGSQQGFKNPDVLQLESAVLGFYLPTGKWKCWSIL